MYKQTCMKNGCQWESYLENPKQCPKCHSKDWKNERRRFIIQDDDFGRKLIALNIGESMTWEFPLINENELDKKAILTHNGKIVHYGLQTKKRFTVTGEGKNQIITRVR